MQDALIIHTYQGSKIMLRHGTGGKHLRRFLGQYFLSQDIVSFHEDMNDDFNTIQCGLLDWSMMGNFISMVMCR